MIKETCLLVTYVSIRPELRVCLRFTTAIYTWKLNILVILAVIRHQARGYQEAIHEGKKYPCRECDYQATSKGHLVRHQQELHDGKKYTCRECEFQATTNGSLTQHQQAVHEGKKYPCSECDHQATAKGDLIQHQRALHEGKKYPRQP